MVYAPTVREMRNLRETRTPVYEVARTDEMARTDETTGAAETGAAHVDTTHVESTHVPTTEPTAESTTSVPRVSRDGKT